MSGPSLLPERPSINSTTTAIFSPCFNWEPRIQIASTLGRTPQSSKSKLVPPRSEPEAQILIPVSRASFSQDAVHLDLWVLDHLRQLLVHNATKSPSLDKTVRAPGTVFFLHLIGLDSTGHSYRPHGSEYHRNLRVVDHIVQETVQLFESVYGDDETAFVFSADHGMSNLGNHGDGSPDNTRTPLITWGAGIGGKDGREKGDQDDYSRDWGLSGTRRDVEQADVAVLMVSFILFFISMVWCRANVETCI